MTNGEDRLDRVERILDETVQALRDNSRDLRETRAIADSNARSIQAWESRIDENRQEAQAAQAELNRQLSDLNSTVATLADIVNVNQEETRQRHQEFLQRFEQHVTQAEADRALMLQLIQAIAQGRNGGQ